MSEAVANTETNPAYEAIRARVDAAEEVTDDRGETSPVKPLGHSSGKYFFVTPVGQQRELKYNEFTWNGILSLFEGDLDWLEKNFPRYGRGGKSLDSFDVDSVTHFLMKECRKAGLYDDSLQIRRAGVWRDDNPPDGGLPRLIVHCGDVLFIDGNKVPVGQRIGNALYESRSKVQHLGENAATAEDGKYLIETLRGWKYELGELGVQLHAGWLGSAMLGAAPGWRAHMMVTAMSGSGKSWLTEAVKNILGSAAHDINNNFTEAFLRQSLNNEGRVMLLDEAEAEENGGRVQRVVELLRHMSGGDGVRGGRGGAGGQSQSFSVTGCAYLSSILHVPLKPADKNRIMHLRINALGSDITPDYTIQLEKRIKRLAVLSPSYRRRMVDGWHHFMTAFEMYRGAFMKQGLNSRAADQMGTIFAGRSVLLFDEVPVSDVIDADMIMAEPMIEILREQIEENNEGLLCLNHLYSSMADSWRGGEKQTIGQMLAQAIQEGSANNNKHLGPWGLRFDPAAYTETGEPEVSIANVSVGLDKLFAGTRWAGGVWAQALVYAGGTKAGTRRYAGSTSKGHCIPKHLWPEDS